MIRQSELNLQRLAGEIFEREHPGRVWRVTGRTTNYDQRPQSVATLMERQNYLLRALKQLRAEGQEIDPDPLELSSEKAGR